MPRSLELLYLQNQLIISILSENSQLISAIASAYKQAGMITITGCRTWQDT